MWHTPYSLLLLVQLYAFTENWLRSCEAAPHWAVWCGTLGTGRKWEKIERDCADKLGHHVVPKGCVIHETADTPGRSEEPRSLLSHCCSGEPCKADANANAHAHPRAQMSHSPTCSSLAKQGPWRLCKNAISSYKAEIKTQDLGTCKVQTAGLYNS